MTNHSWPEYAQAFAAIFAVAAVLAIPLTAFARRPRLSIRKDPDGILTRLEGDQGRVPWVRLVVKNRSWRRAAQHTRVFVDHYRENSSGGPPTSLGGPELGWPSSTLQQDGGVVVFAGRNRPLDFGALSALMYDRTGKHPEVGSSMIAAERIIQNGGVWWLRLTLEMHGRGILISDGRDHLEPRPNGYTVRLFVGADDGAGRTYDVHVNWDGNANDAEAALRSIQLAVTRARRA